jgi:SprT protein
MSPARHDKSQLHRLAQQAIDQTRNLLVDATPLTGKPLPVPPIRFDLRGKSAGQLRIDHHGSCIIRYNLALLDRHGAAFLRDTVPHETAHYVAYRLHGRSIRPHGQEWRQIMQLFGADPSRCHDYDVSGLSTRRLRSFLYHCGCGGHQLSSIRHNRIARGQRYHCRRCGERLRPGPPPAGSPPSP